MMEWLLVKDRLLFTSDTHSSDLSSLILLILIVIFDFEVMSALNWAHQPLDVLRTGLLTDMRGLCDDLGDLSGLHESLRESG